MIGSFLFATLIAISSSGLINLKPYFGNNFSKLDEICHSNSSDAEYTKEKILEGVDSSVSYASNITSYNDFKAAYFDNLTYNFGMNYKGSCGYVALGQLLSYYDTYLNDDIIPEQYDVVSSGYDNNIITRRNSPGIMKDVIVDSSATWNAAYGFTMSTADYYTYIETIKNQSFHAKLISIGAGLGYYNFDNEEYPCSTTFNQRLVVLITYLNSRNLKYSMNYYDSNDNASLSNNVRQFAINEVKKGKPVLLSLEGSVYGHVVVAYDYDSTNDLLYCHMGWSAKNTHVTPESEGYTIYKAALSITFEDEHSHSDNYQVVTTSGGATATQSYCYDSTDVCVYKHDHTHSYLNYSATYHKAFCACGQYELKPHQIDRTTEVKIGTRIYASCKDCKRKIDITSDAGMVASVNLEREEF